MQRIDWDSHSFTNPPSPFQPPHNHHSDALSFTVVLLVASIPIAIEIVCTTTLALGSRELARDGAIVSRLAAIEDMAGVWFGLGGWLED